MLEYNDLCQFENTSKWCENKNKYCAPLEVEGEIIKFDYIGMF